MFQLTNDELERVLRCQNVTTNSNLRSKKLTANELSSKRRYNPYAFTEQGIYMLMTVLKGELAIKQSKTLIRLFKGMKNVKADILTTLFKNQFYEKRIASIREHKFPTLILRYEKRSGWALIATDSSTVNVSKNDDDVKMIDR